MYRTTLCKHPHTVKKLKPLPIKDFLERPLAISLERDTRVCSSSDLPPAGTARGLDSESLAQSSAERAPGVRNEITLRQFKLKYKHTKSRE